MPRRNDINKVMIIGSGPIVIINTPSGKLSAMDDSYIRKTAIRCKVPYITAAALAAARGIQAYREGRGAVRSLQSYHAAM